VSSHISWPTNLTYNQRKALVTLRENRDIIVLPADKGSTTVVLDKAVYLQEAHRQLSDPNTYKRTATDLTYTHTQKISDFITANGPREGISEMSIKYLTMDSPRTTTFYLLPKIHKPDNPGRTIVASYNSLTEGISTLVDSFLQPHVQAMPAYIRDTYHFLEIIRKLPPLPYCFVP